MNASVGAARAYARGARWRQHPQRGALAFFFQDTFFLARAAAAAALLNAERRCAAVSRGGAPPAGNSRGATQGCCCCGSSEPASSCSGGTSPNAAAPSASTHRQERECSIRWGKVEKPFGKSPNGPYTSILPCCGHAGFMYNELHCNILSIV